MCMWGTCCFQVTSDYRAKICYVDISKLEVEVVSCQHPIRCLSAIAWQVVNGKLLSDDWFDSTSHLTESCPPFLESFQYIHCPAYLVQLIRQCWFHSGKIEPILQDMQINLE